jgi:hypothetical protein
MDDIRKDGQPADYTWLWHIPAGMRFQCGAGRWTAVPRRVSGTVLTTEPGKPKGGARFTFTVPADGCYRLAGLTRAGGEEIGKSDSFFVTVNGGKRGTWDLRNAKSFGWEFFAPSEAGSTNLFGLKAGETFRVELHAREAQAQLGRLALVPAQAALPSAPDEDPAAGVTLAADDARLLDPPLVRQPIQPEARPGARLTVFPVTTMRAWQRTAGS